MYVKTKRLELKPMDADGVENLTQLLMDDVVKQTYMLPDFAGRQEARSMAQRIRAMSEDSGRYVAGIYLESQLIGLLNETEICGDCIEVGYAILPRFHNRGYGTEALTGAIGYFFGQGFAQVVAGAFEENAASIRVMEKSGMTKAARTDEVTYRGKTHRCIYYLAQNG